MARVDESAGALAVDDGLALNDPSSSVSGDCSSRTATLRECRWTLSASAFAVLLGLVLVLMTRCSGKAFWCDDFQSQILPGYLDMDRALREGSFPLLSTSCWYGGNLAGEYLFGVFSVVHLLIILAIFQLKMKLKVTAVVFVLTYVAILAGGTFRLARRLGLTVPNAMVVVLATSLNGWLFYWGARVWFPALSSFAWIPWTWWALDRALDPRCGTARFVLAGWFVYLVVAAGFPFTVLMAGIITAWLCLGRFWRLRWRLWPVLAAWTLGLALASPAFLALIEYHQCTNRTEEWSKRDNDGMVAWGAYQGLVIPQMPVEWDGEGAVLSRSYDLNCGLVPIAALLAAGLGIPHGAFRSFRLIRTADRLIDTCLRKTAGFVWRYLGEVILCVIAVLLGFGGSLGPFHWSFRWLPLEHLVLGVLGGLALQRLSNPVEGGSASRIAWGERPGFWACLIIALLLAIYVLQSPTVLHGVLPAGSLLFALSAGWFILEHVLPARAAIRPWLPVMVMVIALPVGNLGQPQPIPHWSIREAVRQSGPLEKERTYLHMLAPSDLFKDVEGAAEINRFGNTPMYAGLSFVNGYSAQYPRVLSWGFGLGYNGETTFPGGWETLEARVRPGGLLEEMGVDGLILSPEFMYLADLIDLTGWELVGQYPMGMVLHRTGAGSPRIRFVGEIEYLADDREVVYRLERDRKPGFLVAKSSDQVKTRLAFAEATIGECKESRLSIRCQVANPSKDREAMITFSRAWYPGYRAFLNGKKVAVEAYNGFQLAARIGPGAQGELRLVFLPPSVVLGATLALSAILATAVFLAIFALTRRSHDRCGSANG